MRLINVVIASIIICICASTAMAEENDEAAKKAFAEGRKLFESGEFIQAGASFRKAHGLSPSWKLLYNIGQSEAAAKHHGLALEVLEMYISQGGDDVPEDMRIEVLADMKRMRDMVGFFEIDAPDGCVVFVDGVERGETPLSGKVPVAAGVVHDVSITQNGDRIFRKKAKVMIGMVDQIVAKATKNTGYYSEVIVETDEIETDEVEIDEDETDQEVSLEIEESKSPLKTAGIITLVTGGVLLAGGGVTGVFGLKKAKEDGAVQSDYKSLGLTTDVLLGVGAAMAVTGVILLVVSSKSKEAPGLDPEQAVSVIPVVGPNTVGATLNWRF